MASYTISFRTAANLKAKRTTGRTLSHCTGAASRARRQKRPWLVAGAPGEIVPA